MSNRPTSLLEQLQASDLLEPRQLEELARLPEANQPDPRALGRLRPGERPARRAVPPGGAANPLVVAM
jgi:hypothetical protein